MESSISPPPQAYISEKSSSIGYKVAAVISVLVLTWFYYYVGCYGASRGQSALGWLVSAWNGETDYEHGFMFPIIILGMIIHQRHEMMGASRSQNLLGLGLVCIGILFYLAAYRTLQPRVAIGALPFLLWGGSLFLWGWGVARFLLFPFFFFWLAIPLPSFQQATTELQLLAASMAYHGSSLFGVETKVVGTTILPVKGDWEPLEIATGCSGIRSLMALLMISCAWAYVAKIALWKKVLLGLSAIPLAILGNALRVTSIFVIAEYGNAKWAAGTWHDWSGLLLFYPFSIVLLLTIHSLFEGGLPWKKGNRKTLSRRQVSGADSK